MSERIQPSPDTIQAAKLILGVSDETVKEPRSSKTTPADEITPALSMAPISFDAEGTDSFAA